MRIPVLALLALLATGCSHHAPARSWKDSQVIEFPRQRLVFQPTRDDMTVGRAVMSLFFEHPDEVRINGVKPEPAWHDVRLTPDGIAVDTRNAAPINFSWLYLYLPKTGKNEFELAPLTIEYSPRAGLVCMNVKAWFDQLTNQQDSSYYQNLDDRYALVSWCTSDPNHPGGTRSRFSQNRVSTVEQFKETITRPLVLRVNQLPLPRSSPP